MTRMLGRFLSLFGIEWITRKPRHVWTHHWCPECKQKRLCEHGGCNDPYSKTCMLCRYFGGPDEELTERGPER